MTDANVINFSHGLPTGLSYDEVARHLETLPVVNIMPTGRTGSDYIQSLLDSHPEVITFVGFLTIYSEFFETSYVFNSDQPAASEAADEFIGRFIQRLSSRYDYEERRDRLGQNGNQSFSIDVRRFKQHLVGLLGDRSLDRRRFLLAVYGAYNLTCGRDLLAAKLVVHHPHIERELRATYVDFPQSKVLYTTRDPRASFCSSVEHMRKLDAKYDCQHHLYEALKFLLADTSVAHELGLDFVSVRLEDLPHEDTIGDLAKWLGIGVCKSLFVSTWLGLEWRGDRVSSEKQAAAPWSATRSSNNWEQRLGKFDIFMLNRLMAIRLAKYGYSDYSLRMWDYIIVPLLLWLPWSYERRFFSWRYISNKLRNRDIVSLKAVIYLPLFYVMRVFSTYRYWVMTLRRKLPPIRFLARSR